MAFFDFIEKQHEFFESYREKFKEILATAVKNIGDTDGVGNILIKNDGSISFHLNKSNDVSTGQ